MEGFCLLVELHWDGSAPAACAAGLFRQCQKTIVWTESLTVQVRKRTKERKNSNKKMSFLSTSNMDI